MTKRAHFVVPFLLLAAIAVYGQISNLSSFSLSFGNVPVGNIVSKSLTITNTGKTILNIYEIDPAHGSQPFYVQLGYCNYVSPGKKCSFNVYFAPTAMGTVSGTLLMSSNASTGNPTPTPCTVNTAQGYCQTVTLTGTGTSTATLTPSTLSFPNQNVGSTSPGKTATLANNGTKALVVNSVSTSANFTQTNNCGTSVRAGGKCNINVYFKPTTSGSLTGTLTVTDGMGTQTTSLSGTGVAVFQSITVTPANTTLVKGATQPYTATGSYNDGTQHVITGPLVWASSNTAAATINSSGLATAKAAGTTTISATSGTIVGRTGLTVTSGVTLQSITVTPANVSIVAPRTQQYAATGNYSDGSHQDLTNSSTWVSTNTATATISATGYATTGVAGTTTISATYSGIMGFTGLTVTHTQTGIVVSPSSKTINTGDSQQFTAYPTYSDNTTGTTAVAATWQSTSTAIAQVDANGLTVGDAAGQANITATSGAYAGSANVTVNASACTTNNRIDMTLLVLTNGRTEAAFPAITTTLNYLHTPYDVVDTNGGVTQGQLNSGCHAFYNGVIVAFLDGGTINPPWSPTTVPFAGWDDLQTFEKTFGIRQLNWFGYPSPDLGFSGYTDFSKPGYTGTYSANAAAVFPYVNLASPLVIDPNAFAVVGDQGSGQALITDASNHALSLLYAVGDGREFLTNTFDSNQYMRHNIMLSYGLVNWVTKGVFVGEKHIFFTPQEDDWGIDDDIWARNDQSYLPIQGVSPPAVGAYPTCTNPSSTVTGMAYRISANDAQGFVNWQTNKQSNPLFANFKLYNAFNSCGLGVNDSNCGSNGSPYPNDTLTAWTQNTANSSHFGWINHTYEHEDLTLQDDGKTGQTYAVDYFQINQNILNEQNLGFADFSSKNMVTPDISGLDYLPALQAMVDNGVQYVVSDTSCGAEKSISSTCFAGTNNGPGAGFNLPIVNSYNPITGSVNTSNVYEVPRRPSNLFYNVGTPDGWQSEYDCIYTNLGGTDPNRKPYGTYATQDIMDFISGVKGVYPNFVDLMMQGDADPEMFHQTNLRAYNSSAKGNNSLLSDLLDETFGLYQSYFNLPVQSMSLDGLGQFMLNNRAFAPIDPSTGTPSWNVSGTVNNGSSRTVTLTVTNAATIPVTGLQSAGAEQYGGQPISHVPMAAGQTLTQPAP